MQEIQQNVGMQGKIGSEFYGIGGLSAEGSNRFAGGNQATGGHDTTFSNQTGKSEFLNFAEPFVGSHQQHGIGEGNHGLEEGSNRFVVGGNQGKRQLRLGKAEFNLNFAEPFVGFQQQRGIAGNSKIPRISVGNAEGTSSRKYSHLHHQIIEEIGKSSGDDEQFNQEWSGSETESDDGLANLAHKTSKTMAAKSRRLELEETNKLQQIFLSHKKIREYLNSKKGGTSKSDPIESVKIASQNEEELSRPNHTSQKLPQAKKSKKQ